MKYINGLKDLIFKPRTQISSELFICHRTPTKTRPKKDLVSTTTISSLLRHFPVGNKKNLIALIKNGFGLKRLKINSGSHYIDMI